MNLDLDRELFGVRNTLLLSIAWALGFVLVDILLPIWRVERDPWPVLQVGLGMVCAGPLIGLFVTLAVPRLGPRALALSLPLAAAVVTLLHLMLTRELLPLLSPRFSAFFARRLFADQWSYVYWSVLLYGGLLTIAAALAWRAERSRSLRARAEIERQRTDATLAAERLAGWRAQIDPAFLLDAVEACGRCYAEDRARGEAMLDALIVRLRRSMPAVRGAPPALSHKGVPPCPHPTVPLN
jgi:hypothetical protein